MHVVEDLNKLASLLGRFRIDRLTVYLNKYDLHEAKKNIGDNIVYPIVVWGKNNIFTTTGTLHIKGVEEQDRESISDGVSFDHFIPLPSLCLNPSNEHPDSVEYMTKTTINGVQYCASTILPTDFIKNEGDINAIRQVHKEKILKSVLEKSKDGYT